MEKGLEDKILEEPIHLPSNPFWQAFKSFGTDEAISGALNIASTAAAEFIGLGIAGMSLAGPIIEKAGFFPAHIKEAMDVYKTTPEESRGPFSYYIKEAFKGGAKNLLLDIAIHDPLYVTMMYSGLKEFPDSPAWALAGGSFVLAAIVASAVDVGVSEIKYKIFQRKLKNVGFGIEPYLESRFFISNEMKPEEVLGKLKERFNLGEVERRKYNDVYFPRTGLEIYSGREGKLRLRKRQEGREWMQTAQIVYTRVGSMGRGKPQQFLYYPIKKEKMYFKLDQAMPKTIKEVEDSRVRKVLSDAIVNEEQKVIEFERCSARGTRDGLLASVDTVYSGSDKRDFG